MLPPAALGLICENRVAEMAIAGSLAEVVPFKSLVDIDGSDLLCKWRKRTANLRIQVKGRAELTRLGTFNIAVYDSELDVRDPKLVVAMHYDVKAQQVVDPIFVIPSTHYRARAHHTHGQWSTLISIKPTSKDQWVPYRCAQRDFAKVLLAHLEAAEERGETATPREVRWALQRPPRRRVEPVKAPAAGAARRRRPRPSRRRRGGS